ncbi:hypothetical protein ONZ45_g11629 [Pleurotus djamor]|nr:hypothetical protein ONZ45_g11629 [Pleurotus djamor]
MTTIRYQVPNLFSLLGEDPTKEFIHPHYEALDTWFNAWMATQEISPITKKRWLAVKMPSLASLTNPHMTLEQLQVVLEYMVMSLAMEDLTDSASSKDADKWARFFSQMLREPGTADEELIKDEPMAKIVNELSKRVMKSLGPFYAKPFIMSNDALVRGMTRESADREVQPSEATTSSVGSYIETRRTTIGVEPILVMFRWASKIDLPDNVLDSPLVKGLANAAIEMVFLANDIYSYKKELIANAAQHNVISVIMSDPSVRSSDLQGAFDYAAGVFKASRQKFDALLTELHTTDMWFAHREDLQKYADNMMHWAVGNVSWSVITPRYRVFDTPESKSSAIVEFKINY